MLLGHAGNRLNKDIEELAYVAAEFSPELIVVKEDEGHLRGRQPGEVPGIILNAFAFGYSRVAQCRSVRRRSMLPAWRSIGRGQATRSYC